MSWFSKATGADGRREKKQRDAALRDYGDERGIKGLWQDQIREYADPTQGMDQLAELIRSQVSGAMPQLNAALQGSKENAIARGISTGDLGTSYEGDVHSAFQRNIANAIAPQVFGLYSGNRNTYLDMLVGQQDRDDMNRNAAKNRNAAMIGGGIGAIGSMFDFSFGGGK